MGEKCDWGQTQRQGDIMKFIHILVEGQTEEAFINDMITPHLRTYQLEMTPIILSTKRTKSGIKYKGGDVKYQKLKKELGYLLKNTHTICVTMMIDFYGLRATQDFPSYMEIPYGTAYEKIQFLEKAIQDDINHQRFLPYFSLHEIEALLFASPATTADYFGIEPHLLHHIKNDFKTPEEIDLDNPPSHRLYDLYPEYGKVNELVQAIEKIPLTTIRAECPHFNQWLTKLEALGISP